MQKYRQKFYCITRVRLFRIQLKFAFWNTAVSPGLQNSGVKYCVCQFYYILLIVADARWRQ